MVYKTRCGLASRSVLIMEAVVEFHGFVDDLDEFIVKEIAVVSGTDYTLLHCRSPYEKRQLDKKHRRIATWLENEYHRIPWSYGTAEYSDDVMRTLCSPFTTVYTKGRQKREFLQRFHVDVREIPESTPKPSAAYRTHCPLHRTGKRCALKSACFYMEYMTRKELDVTREADRIRSFANANVLNPCDLAAKGFYFSLDGCVARCARCEKELGDHDRCVYGFAQNVPLLYENIVPRMKEVPGGAEIRS